jgi:hypothetical protein
VLAERGDLGNWLNMPYFSGDEGNRYALDAEGKAMKLKTFIEWVEKHKFDPEKFLKLVVDEDVAELKDGPPCLQSLCAQGFPQGTRNNGLFALGVFARKKWPDDWQKHIEAFNQKFLHPPLETKEVQTIIKQVAKKDYQYRCSDQPIVAFCNSGMCRIRKYGVGSGGSQLHMANLTKLDTKPPVWFIEVENRFGEMKKMEMTTEQLQKQSLFQAECMSNYEVMPPRVRDKDWQEMMSGVMHECRIIEAPPDVGIDAMFEEVLEMFITDSHMQSMTRDEIILGKPWRDDETGRILFRIRDLHAHLLRNNFRHYTRSQISARLLEYCDEWEPWKMNPAYRKAHTFYNIGGKGCNLWWVPLDMFTYQTEPHKLPKMTKIGEKM